jgi:hypothetical protein
LTVGLIAISVVGLFVLPWSSSIESHKSALAKLQYPPAVRKTSDYFSRAYLLWNLQGRPNNREAMEIHDRHMESLIALGYLKRRTFQLEHQELDLDGLLRLNNIVQQAYASGVLKESLAQYSANYKEAKAVIVVSRPDELKAWEKLIRSFDSTNAVPHKLLQAMPDHASALFFLSGPARLTMIVRQSNDMTSTRDVKRSVVGGVLATTFIGILRPAQAADALTRKTRNQREADLLCSGFADFAGFE